MNSILLIPLASICIAATITFIKIYTQTKNIIWIILSMIGFTLLIYIYTILFLNKSLTIIYPMVIILSVFLVVFISYFFFNGILNLQIGMGLLLGIISIYLLSTGNNR